MSNDQITPTFILNGLRIKFNINNAVFPSDVDLVVVKESSENNSVCFNISLKPKETEGLKENNSSEPVETLRSDDINTNENSNHIESSKSRVSFKGILLS